MSITNINLLHEFLSYQPIQQKWISQHDGMDQRLLKITGQKHANKQILIFSLV
jgi:hypothetical protein